MRLLAIAILFIGVSATYALSHFKFSLKDKTVFDSSVSHFISFESKNEYVIQGLNTSETFTETRDNVLTMFSKEFHIGSITVSLQIPAKYRFYIKPNEVNVYLDKETLYVTIRDLYLQEPVAFDTAGVIHTEDPKWFSPNKARLLDELHATITEKLSVSGKALIDSTRLEASKSLANNINQYLKEKGYEGFYKEIIITFTEGNTINTFGFNNSLCGDAVCKFQFPLGNKVISVGEK